MPDPTTAAEEPIPHSLGEWVGHCNLKHQGIKNGVMHAALCLDCADAYARQQVETLLTALEPFKFRRNLTTEEYAAIRAAIRALEP